MVIVQYIPAAVMIMFMAIIICVIISGVIFLKEIKIK